MRSVSGRVTGLGIHGLSQRRTVLFVFIFVAAGQCRVQSVRCCCRPLLDAAQRLLLPDREEPLVSHCYPHCALPSQLSISYPRLDLVVAPRSRLDCRSRVLHQFGEFGGVKGSSVSGGGEWLWIGALWVSGAWAELKWFLGSFGVVWEAVVGRLGGGRGLGGWRQCRPRCHRVGCRAFR